MPLTKQIIDALQTLNEAIYQMYAFTLLRGGTGSYGFQVALQVYSIRLVTVLGVGS